VDAQTAHAAGADRLELCSALELGGLTPSIGLLREIKLAVPLPVMMMIRPRPGNFLYSASEFKTMQRDIEFALINGAHGVVFGLLTPSRDVDYSRTRMLVEQAGWEHQTVFHRAFDQSRFPQSSLEVLVSAGVTRVLTSGQQPAAPAGAELIREMVERAAGRIEVLPGAGITPENIRDVLARTGATQIHGSFSVVDPANEPHQYTSQESVTAARAACNSWP